jgi:hypothetical protein
MLEKDGKRVAIKTSNKNLDKVIILMSRNDYDKYRFSRKMMLMARRQD